MRGQQLETALHLADGVAQGVGGQLGLGDDGREEMGNAFVHAQLDALGVDENEANLRGSGAIEQAHNHGVDGHGFAGARGAGDEHVGHLGQIGGADEAVDVFAHGDGEARFGFAELFRLDAVAQVDGLAAMVGHLDADGVFAGHALDENGFGAHGEAKIVVQSGDAGVFDAGLGLELVGGDHGAGIDLDDLAANTEFGAFFDQDAGLFAQLVLADGLGLFAGVEQRAGRQFEAADVFGATAARCMPASARSWMAISSVGRGSAGTKAGLAAGGSKRLAAECTYPERGVTGCAGAGCVVSALGASGISSACAGNSTALSQMLGRRSGRETATSSLSGWSATRL